VDSDWHDSYEETGQMLQEFKTHSIWANMGEALSGNSGGGIPAVCSARKGVPTKIYTQYIQYIYIYICIYIYIYTVYIYIYMCIC
jgi:hypothetical protein